MLKVNLVLMEKKEHKVMLVLQVLKVQMEKKVNKVLKELLVLKVLQVLQVLKVQMEHKVKQVQEIKDKKVKKEK